MPFVGDDFPGWLKVLGVGLGWLVSVVCAAASTSWFAGRKTMEMERNDGERDRKIKELENQRDRMERFCAQRKVELITELQKDICHVVELANKDLIIDQNSKLAIIGIDVAVQANLMKQIQKDVEAIFGRLNRRNDDHEDHGERRKDH